MKKIQLIICLSLTFSLLFISCKKNNSENVNATKLTVIRSDSNTEVKSPMTLKKFFRKIGNLTKSSDNPAAQREREVIAKFEDDKIIKIGIASSWDENITDAHNAIMMALNEVNEKGVLGAQVELIQGNDMADEAEGLRVAYKLAEDKEICAIIGHAYSNISVPASLIYSYYGMLMFNPISTAHTLTRPKNSMIFRNIQDDTEYGKMAADLCDSKGWKNVAICYLDFTVGESMSNAFELACGSKDITIATRDSFTLSQTESEYKRLFKKWKNNYKFDAVLVIGNMPQIESVVKYLREAGITQPIIGNASFDDPMLESLFADSEDGRLYAISPFNNESKNSKYLNFVNNFEKIYGHKPDQEGVQWYDAFNVLISAIEQNGNPAPSQVAKVIRGGDWNDVAGPYTFDDYGNVVGKPIVVKEMINGKYKIISDLN